VRLLIVKNPDSPLLKYLDAARDGQKVALIQNGVYSEKLRAQNALVLEPDARARAMASTDGLIDYGQLLDAIFEADRVLCI
jgi:hypothetical protein